MSNATHDHDNTARPERAIDNGEAWEDTRDLQAYATQTYGLDPTSVGQLIDWCEGASRAAGRPFARVIKRRWDERGEPIGPDDRIGRDEAEIVLDVVEAVTRARSTALAAAVEPGVAGSGVAEGSGEPSTNCPRRMPWCSTHLVDKDGEQCVSNSVDISPRLSVWLLLEGRETDPGVVIDAGSGARLSTREAGALQAALNELQAAVLEGREVRP